VCLFWVMVANLPPPVPSVINSSVWEGFDTVVRLRIVYCGGLICFLNASLDWSVWGCMGSFIFVVVA
jgi:hypothetical protein